MNLQECFEKATTELRETAERRSANKKWLHGRPKILIFDQRSATYPMIAGDLVKCENGTIEIITPEALIRYSPNESVIYIDQFPLRIELEWLETQSGGYYGETKEEYGGEPERFPSTVAKAEIIHKGTNDWKYS